MKHENQKLTKPEETPTPERMKEALGESFETYQAFQKKLPGLELVEEWKYYNCGSKSWLGNGKYRWISPRGANKEKTIFWLSAWDGYFHIAIWFLDKNRLELLKANVSEKTKKQIRESKIFGEKMRTFPIEFEITDEEQLADIYELIAFKKRLEA